MMGLRPAAVCALAASVVLVAATGAAAQVEQTPTELWEEYPLDPTQAPAAGEEGKGEPEPAAGGPSADTPARDGKRATRAGREDLPVLAIAAAAAVLLVLLLAGTGVLVRADVGVSTSRRRHRSWIGRFPHAVSRVGVAGASLAAFPSQLAGKVQPIRTTRRLAGFQLRLARGGGRSQGTAGMAGNAKKPPAKKPAPARPPLAKQPAAPPKRTPPPAAAKPVPAVRKKPPRHPPRRPRKPEATKAPAAREEPRETCVIVWRREGARSDFYALASHPERGDYVVAASPVFEWAGGEIPEEAWQAHSRLVTTLAEGGWRLVATEGPWYRRRFERPAGSYPLER